MKSPIIFHESKNVKNVPYSVPYSYHGSTNGHLAPRDVGHVLVPRLKEGTEERIAGLVEDSLGKRVESEKLLDQAKTRVEQLIEEAVRS